MWRRFDMGKIKRGRYDCMGRECNDCGKFKLWKEFNRSGNGNGVNNRRSYCRECHNLRRKPRTKEQRIHKYKQKIKRRERRILEAIPESSNKHYGFVYAYWCQELKCFKIGKTKQNPVDYMKVKSLDYGLHFELYCYISSPIKDYDAEWIISRKVIDKRVKHKKPCGGIARELYKCCESEVLEAMSAVNNAVVFG